MSTEIIDTEKAGKTVDYWRKRAEMMEDALGFLHPSKKKDLVRRAAGYSGGRESGRRRRVKHMESIYDYPRLKQDDGDVDYIRETDRQNEFCGNCLFFIGRRDVSFGSCSVVEGLIDNAGVCKLWEEIEVVPNPELQGSGTNGLVAMADSVNERVRRFRFGDYAQKEACDTCKSKKSLVVHHKMYKTCEDCASDGDRGTCKKSGHHATLCKSCHEIQHAGDTKKAEIVQKVIAVTFIEKKDDEQIVTGIVLQPDTVDAQSDKISAPEIVKSRKAFQDAKAIFLQHRKKVAEKDFDIIEDYITKEDVTIGDEEVKKGSWILSVKIHSAEIWKEVKEGNLTGFSIKGMAKRVPVAA